MVGPHGFDGYKFVAHAVNGANQDGTVRIVLDLLAQFRNAIVHSAVTGALPLWPRGTNQLLARDNDPRAQYQKLQNLEFPECQPHNLIGAMEFHPLEIQREIPELRRLTRFSDRKIFHADLCDRTQKSTSLRKLTSTIAQACHERVTFLLNPRITGSSKVLDARKL